MHKASQRGHLDLVELFVGVGVDINFPIAEEKTPLHLASGPGYLEVARFLIEHGADLNSCDKEGWTPLHTAARNGHFDIVRLLLERGEGQGQGVQVRNSNHETPLILASFGGHLECGYSLNGEQACKSELCMAERPLSSHYCLDNRRSHSFCQSMMSVEYRYSTNKGLIPRYIYT